MSQHDYSLDNQTGANFRSDLNSALGAIVSNNSGATEPPAAGRAAYMLWADTTTGILKLRNAANSAWISVIGLASGEPVDWATKADLTSPIFTGNPTAPTPSTSDNTTSVATTAYVKNQGYAKLITPTFSGTVTAGMFSGAGTGLTGTAAGLSVNYATTAGSAAPTAGSVVQASLSSSFKTWRVIANVSVSSGVSATLDGISGSYTEYKLVAYSLSRLGSANNLLMNLRYNGVNGTQFGVLVAGTSPDSQFEYTFYGPGGLGAQYMRMTSLEQGVGVADIWYNFGVASYNGFRFYTTGNGPFSGEFVLYGR